MTLSMAKPKPDEACQCPNQALQADIDRRIAKTLSILDTRILTLWRLADREENGRVPPISSGTMASSAKLNPHRNARDWWEAARQISGARGR